MASGRAGTGFERERPDDKPAKSRIRRARSRLLVRFGTNGTDRTAFTQNISESGLFLQTNQAYPPGTTVQLLLQFPDREFSLWGRVVWAKRVPPQLAHLLHAGMGIRFVQPTPEWLEFYGRWKSRFGL